MKKLLGTLALLTLPAGAEDFPALREDDSFAKTLNYHADAAKAPGHTGPAASQKCGNCGLYSRIDKKRGRCQLFPGRSVSEGGWCSSWVAIPKS